MQFTCNSFFYAESLDVLELSYCKLQQPRENVKLFSLRKLALREICADDQVIASLISGCPLIEYLEIRSCEGLESLELVNLSNLNEIILVSTCDIKCQCTNYSSNVTISN